MSLKLILLIQVGWLEGSHPTFEEGMVNRTLCVTEISGHCGYSQVGQVRPRREWIIASELA